MRISTTGREFIELRESLRLKAYKPTPDDVLTIGYGHTGPDVYQGMIITPFEADQFLTQDLLPVENAIHLYVKVPLWQWEYDALCSLILNVGISAFRHSSALTDLNNTWKDGFIDQAFSREHGWVHQAGHVLEGLVNRRKAEQALFQHADYGSKVSASVV